SSRPIPRLAPVITTILDSDITNSSVLIRLIFKGSLPTLGKVTRICNGYTITFNLARTRQQRPQTHDLQETIRTGIKPHPGLHTGGRRCRPHDFCGVPHAWLCGYRSCWREHEGPDPVCRHREPRADSEPR